MMALNVRLRLRNDLYCVEWGVKLYSLTLDQTGNNIHEEEMTTSDETAAMPYSLCTYLAMKQKYRK